VICWAVIEFIDEDAPDEVVGQIFNGDCLTEASAVDEEEGFGEFVGYYPNEGEAIARISQLELEIKNKGSKKEDDEDRDEDNEDEEEDIEDEEEDIEDEEEDEEDEEEDEEDSE